MGALVAISGLMVGVTVNTTGAVPKLKPPLAFLTRCRLCRYGFIGVVFSGVVALRVVAAVLVL